MAKCYKGFQELLLSRRFQLLVLAALAYYLDNFGFTLDAHGVALFIQQVAGVALGVGTVDKVAEKVGK